MANQSTKYLITVMHSDGTTSTRTRDAAGKDRFLRFAEKAFIWVLDVEAL